MTIEITGFDLVVFVQALGVIVVAAWVLEAGLNLVDKYIGRR